VTGGAGFIGSHTVIELFAAGYEVIVIDNLVNARLECLKRVEQIAGKKATFYSVDLLNKEAVKKLFSEHKIHHVIHFAGLKAVGESVEKPLLYYHNNLIGTINLLEVMAEFAVKHFIFSSSATVYGSPQYLPVNESHPVGGCTNAYGKTKFMIEEILQDIYNSDKSWNIVILRYFNPVGAHSSGMIGEDPSGAPNNLMPFVAQVAVGRRPEVMVFGSDYDTPDGTGVRDYIHVVDLAVGHVNSLNCVKTQCGLKIYNLGLGIGYSVLDMIKAMEKACGHKIDYKIVDRRAGDTACVYSDCTKAEKELGWKAKRGLDEMCKDLWHWQQSNPHGFNPPKST